MFQIWVSFKNFQEYEYILVTFQWIIILKKELFAKIYKKSGNRPTSYVGQISTATSKHQTSEQNDWAAFFKFAKYF